MTWTRKVSEVRWRGTGIVYTNEPGVDGKDSRCCTFSIRKQMAVTGVRAVRGRDEGYVAHSAPFGQLRLPNLCLPLPDSYPGNKAEWISPHARAVAGTDHGASGGWTKRRRDGVPGKKSTRGLIRRQR